MVSIRKDDIQDIVGEVRNMLELRSDPSEAELQRLAKKYGTAVQQVNSLLKTCLELVEKGLKLDAISRADENSLLEIVSILDFPERLVWADYLNQFELPAPPEIDQFASRQINACYAPARRLEPLYRENRRHALANSPLQVKLGVMRRIHKMEQASGKDMAARQVELFETERLKRVRKELADAQDLKDHRKLNLLCTELNSKDWLKAPDAVLVRNAVRALRQEEARRARLRMKELATDLQSMWSAHDVVGGRRIREAWNTCLKQAQLTEDDRLILETQSAFLWLREIDEEEANRQRYEGLVAQLRDGLDQRVPRELLEPLEHALEAFEDGIPLPMQTRLQTRYDELETESHRKYVRRLIVLSLTVISTAGLAVLLLHNRGISETIAGHTAALEILIERADVDAAESYVETLRQEQPEMLDVPHIKILMVDIEQSRQIEDARLAAFETGRQAITEGLASAITLSDVQSLRERLEAMVPKDAEADDVERLSSDIDKKCQQIQQRNDDAFTISLQEAAEEFRDYETTGSMDIVRLKEFSSRFLELGQTPDVSPELIAGSAGPNELAARCDMHIFDMNAQATRGQMLQQISASVGSLPVYRSAIDAYVKQFPKDTISLRFENLLRTEADVWPQVEVLNKFVLEHSMDCTSLKPKQARDYVAEAEAFLITHPAFPRRMDLERIREYLRFVSQRIDADDKPIHDSIPDQLDSARLKDLFMILTLTGQRHYSSLKPEILMDPGRVRIYPLTGWDAAVRVRQTKAINFPTDSLDIRRKAGEPDWNAPESVLIMDLKEDLRLIDEMDWERVMVNMLERVYGEMQQHPVFRLFMLRTILQISVAGSPVISERYSRVAEELNSERLDRINPFDPEDETTNTAAAHASALLKTLENPATLFAKIMAHREALRKVNIGAEYRWIGWLNHTAAGWEVISASPLSADMDGRLLIYSKAGAESPRFYPIGTVTTGKSTISDASVFLAEGHPVYFYVE